MESSTLLVLASGLVGAVITGSYQFLYDRYMRPKLKLDFEGAEDRDRVEIKRQEAGKTFSEVYIRSRLRNVGRHSAKKCLVFLTGIKEVLPAGVTSAPFHDAKPLSWPGWDFTPRDVPQGVDFYVNVFKISKDDPGWFISVEKLFSNQQKLKDYKGTYRFELLATADNAEPMKFEIEATYSGDWNNLRVVGS